MTGVIPGIKVDQADTPPGAFCCPPPPPPPPPPPCWFCWESPVSFESRLGGSRVRAGTHLFGILFPTLLWVLWRCYGVRQDGHEIAVG